MGREERMEQKPGFWRPVLIGGLVSVVLGVLPPFCCCCGGVGLAALIGGLVSGALYAGGAGRLRWYPGSEEGATAGAAAGLLSGVVIGGLSAMLVLVRSALVSWSAVFDLEPWGLYRFSRHDWGRGVTVLFVVAISTGIGVLSGAIGGALGLVLFRKPTAGSLR